MLNQLEKLYVVKDKDGTLNLCFGKPIRNEKVAPIYV